MKKLFLFLILALSLFFVSPAYAASVQVSATSINVGDSVTCTYFSDVQNKAYLYYFAWFKGSSSDAFIIESPEDPYAQYAYSTINSGFSAGDTLTCAVYDLITNTRIAESETIYVQGATPSAGNAVIMPINPVTTDNLVGILEGGYAGYLYYFNWYKNNQFQFTLTNSTGLSTVVDSSLTKKHDNWRVEVYNIDNAFISSASVNIINSNPIILPIPNIVRNVNQNIVVDVDATDADNDPLNYALFGTIPSGMTIDPNTGLINWTPTNAQIGTHTINVRVADFDNGIAVASFTITVNAVVDNPPVVNLESPADGASFTVSSITFNYNTTDDNGINNAQLLIDGIVTQTDITVSMGVTQSFVQTVADGTHTWQVCVNDTINQRVCSVTRTFNVSTVIPDTTPPAITNINVVVTNQSATITINTNENSNASINYGLTTSLGTIINDATFALTHSININGLNSNTTYYFRATVCDVNGNCNTTQLMNFTTLANVVNQPPVLAEIGNKVVNEGSRLNFTVSATDPENDTLTFYASGLPSGATFVNRMFDWTPNFTQSGTYLVTFNVTDGISWDSETIQITVNDVNQSNAPYFTSTPIKKAKVGEDYVYYANATCPAGGEIRYKLVEYPDGMKINKYTGLIEWEPIEDGSYNVRIQARSLATNLVAYQEYEIKVTEGKIEDKDLFIKSAKILNEKVSPGDVMDIQVSVKNNANAEFDDLKITVLIDELGIRTTSGPFDLGYGDEKTRILHLEIPSNTKSKDYDVKVTVSNDKTHRVVYRVVHVSSRENENKINQVSNSEVFEIELVRTTPVTNMLNNNPQGLNWLSISFILFGLLTTAGLIFFLLWKGRQEEKQKRPEILTNF